MPYYHVRIRNRKGQEFFEFDQTKRSMDDLSLLYLRGEPVRIGGIEIDPGNVEKIRIFETELPNSEIIGARPWDVGTEVTRDFLDSALAKSARQKALTKNIFIVHGRDHKPMQELKAMLKKLGLEPVVLHEQPSGSRTIVEKLERYSDVGYTFVILTPDDIGVSFQDLFEKTAKSSYDDKALSAARRILEQSKGSIERFIEFNQKFMQDPEDASKFLEFLKPRSRQNVVLEFGYFMGLLDRDRVCCLHKGDVELPSDMHGIVYISFKESIEECRDRIIEELKAVGYEIRV